MLLCLSGFGLSIQSAINGSLGKTVGSFGAAFISCFVASIVLLAAVFMSDRTQISHILKVPIWELSGGILGAIYVSCLTLLIPRTGTVLATVCIVSGQMIMSACIDHFGWFHVQQSPLNSYRLAGLILLLIALILIYKGSSNS